MALKLLKMFKGIGLNYWKITNISEDIVVNKTTVGLSVYINDAARKANVRNMLDHKVVQIAGTDLTRAQIYAAIKALPAFKGAVDC